MVQLAEVEGGVEGDELGRRTSNNSDRTCVYRRLTCSSTGAWSARGITVELRDSFAKIAFEGLEWEVDQCGGVWAWRRPPGLVDQRSTTMSDHLLAEDTTYPGH